MTHNSRSEYVANCQLETKVNKVKRLANMPNKSFAFRLAAIVASDTAKGKKWGHY